MKITNHPITDTEEPTTVENVRDYLVWRDDTLARWLLANGWQMRRSPEPPEEMYEQGFCYANSMEVASACGYDYCEGFAESSIGIPLEHAWCLVDDGDGGAALDVTWRHECQDFFGVIIPNEIAADIVLKNDVYGILPNLWMLDGDERGLLLAQIADANREFREAAAA